MRLALTPSSPKTRRQLIVDLFQSFHCSAASTLPAQPRYSFVSQFRHDASLSGTAQNQFPEEPPPLHTRFRHLGIPSCPPPSAIRIAPVPNSEFPTSGLRLLFRSGRSGFQDARSNHRFPHLFPICGVDFHYPFPSPLARAQPCGRRSHFRVLLTNAALECSHRRLPRRYTNNSRTSYEHHSLYPVRQFYSWRERRAVLQFTLTQGRGPFAAPPGMQRRNFPLNHAHPDHTT